MRLGRQRMDYGLSLIDGVPEAREVLIANPLSFGSAGHPQHEADLFRCWVGCPLLRLYGLWTAARIGVVLQ